MSPFSVHSEKRTSYIGQVATLSNYLADHGTELVDKNGVMEVMANIGNRFVSLTRNDLRIGGSIMKEKLAPIYRPLRSIRLGNLDRTPRR